MPAHSIHIRHADLTDSQLLAELGARTFSDAFAASNTPEDMTAYLASAFSPEKQAAEIAQPGSLFLIAEIDGAPVGYARLRESAPPACVSGERPLEIGRFYSAKEWIGRGVGPALMQACLEEAARRGCDVIWLSTWQRNPRGLAFYQKWGFQIVGTATFQLGSDLQHDYLLQRPVELNPAR